MVTHLVGLSELECISINISIDEGAGGAGACDKELSELECVSIDEGAGGAGDCDKGLSELECISIDDGAGACDK